MAYQKLFGQYFVQYRGGALGRSVLAGHILNNRIMIFNLLNQGATDLTQLSQNSHGRRFFKKEGVLCAEVSYPREQFRAHNWNILDSCVQL